MTYAERGSSNLIASRKNVRKAFGKPSYLLLRLLLEAYYNMGAFPGPQLMERVYQRSMELVEAMGGGGGQEGPSGDWGTEGPNGHWREVTQRQSTDVVYLASIVWLVAELGERHASPPDFSVPTNASHTPWLPPSHSWVGACLKGLSPGLRDLPDLPGRARPVLMLLRQAQRAVGWEGGGDTSDREHGCDVSRGCTEFLADEAGPESGEYALDKGGHLVSQVPHPYRSFLSSFYSALDGFLSAQEALEWGPARDLLGNSPRARPSSRSGGGEGAGDSWAPTTAIKRRAINQLLDLCRGAEMLPLMLLGLPEDIRPPPGLVDKWLWGCLGAIQGLWLSQQRALEMAVDRRSKGHNKSSWSSDSISSSSPLGNVKKGHVKEGSVAWPEGRRGALKAGGEERFVPAYFPDLLVHAVDAGLTPSR